MSNQDSTRVNRTKPELTPERRAAMHAWYDGAISSMKNEFDSWYPEGNVSTDTVSAEHAGFSDRITSISNELGYRKWYELGSAIGLTLEGEQPGDLLNLDARLDSANTTLWKKISKSLENIDRWYPEGTVVDYKKAHTKSCENLNILAKKFGFESWQTLLTSCGYEVVNTYSNKGGRPQIIDYVGIINSLKERYVGSPAASMRQLECDNPEIPWKSLANNSKREFGGTLASHLKEMGVLRDKVKPLLNEDELWQTVNQLVDKYSALANKPTSLSELYYLEPEAATCMHRFGSKATDMLGQGPSAYFKSHGVLVAKKTKKKGLSDEECNLILKSIFDKYRDHGTARHIKAFKEDNEDYARNLSAINAYIKKTYGKTTLQLLTERGIISKAARENSNPRPTRNLVQEFEAKNPLITVEELKNGCEKFEIVELQSAIEADLDSPCAANYGMLHPGDIIEFAKRDDSLAHAYFCDHDLGSVGHSPLAELHLERLFTYPAEYGLINQRVYAQVLDTTGNSCRNSANIHAWFAINPAALNVKNGVLLSRDGKTALGLVKRVRALTVPEGVEVIANGAFACRPFTKVTLPGTLRIIESRAFSLCGTRTYTIPASVERIEAGAFSFHLPCHDEPSLQYIDANGPVKIDVAEGNGRYCSINGSLIEVDDNQVTLLSLFYRGVSRNADYSFFDAAPVKLVVPEGVTRLASHCVSAARYMEYDVNFPETLTTIDKDAFVAETWVDHRHMAIKNANIPARLTDIHHSFWKNVAEKAFTSYSHGEPLADLELVAKVVVDRGNSRYSVHGGMLHDSCLAAQQAGEMILGNDVLERPSEHMVEEFFARLSHDELDPFNPLAIDIPVSIELPHNGKLRNECTRAWSMLRKGDILSVDTVKDENEVLVTEFDHPLGVIISTAENFPLAAHPLYAAANDEAAKAAGFAQIERRVFTDGQTGKTTSYTFAFLDDADDSALKELLDLLKSQHPNPEALGMAEPEIAIRAQYLKQVEGNDSVENALPGIREVIDRYAAQRGVGQPIVIVDSIIENTGSTPSYAATGTLKLLYEH